MAIIVTNDEAAQTYRSLVVLVYLGAYVWAIAVSGRRWATLKWMFLSLVATGLLLAGTTVVLEAITKNEFIGMGMADLFTIPSLAVPAIVGVIHARRHRRKPQANTDS